MQNLIIIIESWPGIVQGALGSGLFALLLFIGQWFAIKLQNIAVIQFKNARKSALTTESMRLRALKAKGDDMAHFAGFLVYRMSRPLLKALIWMMLGFIFNDILGVFSTIGFIGAIYYLFQALNVVKPINYDGDIEERLKEIKEEKIKLKK